MKDEGSPRESSAMTRSLILYPLSLILSTAVVLVPVGCGKTASKEESPPPKTNVIDGPSKKADFTALRPKIKAFCGACHMVPDPATFPKRAWYDEVALGYRLYDESNRHDLSPPPMSDVVAYYRHFAPEQLALPKVVQTDGSARATFETRQVRLPAGIEVAGVSHLFPHSLPGSKRELLLCDMRIGEVRRVNPADPQLKAELLAKLHNPAHIEPVDFGNGGRRDYVVAELGTFLPADHDKGRITWLRARNDGAGYDAIVLKAGLARVADVRPADFDGDGKLDLIVAEFGWRKTGRILLLKQTGSKDGVPQFQTIEVDKRHGTIHVPVVDLNKDGRPDFIALVSQEHEAIDAFLNKGDGAVERKRIFEANDPSYGSSGIEVVDLDGDGDLDVVYTNGDSLDSHYLKPYHAVHWLENRGTFPFTHHELTRLPGASRAIAVDLDGDGDLDIACAAYLPPSIINEQAGGKIDSLIWLEQREEGQFVRHGIERSATGYLSLVAGDFDGDGAPDLAAGHFQKSAGGNWVTLWLTRRK